MAEAQSIRQTIASADIIIGAVHIAGSRTPQLISRAMVRAMKPRSVIVDVAIDQGGSAETSKPTSHDKPTYMAEGILHYCVPNMPGAYGRTSTLALTNSTLGYVLLLARTPLTTLARESRAVAQGIQCYGGHVACRPVADAQKRPHRPLEQLLSPHAS
jgi:alanine dehydrogenase